MSPHRTVEAACVVQKERGKLQCGVCPEKRMAKLERRWTRRVSASLMAITSHLPKGWVSERYSCSDSSACLRLRMRCATPMHSTAPPAIQVKVTPLRPVSGRPEPFWSTMVKLSLPVDTAAEPVFTTPSAAVTLAEFTSGITSERSCLSVPRAMVNVTPLAAELL